MTITTVRSTADPSINAVTVPQQANATKPAEVIKQDAAQQTNTIVQQTPKPLPQTQIPIRHTLGSDNAQPIITTPNTQVKRTNHTTPRKTAGRGPTNLYTIHAAATPSAERER